MSDVRTLNLSDADDGMVSLDNPSTSFVQENAKKNVSEHKDTMDSTSIADIMGNSQELLEPPHDGYGSSYDASDYAPSPHRSQ